MFRNFRYHLIQLTGKRWLHHLLFWSVSFLVLLFVFKPGEQIQKIDLIYTSIFHLSLLPVVYIHTGLLIPYLLRKGNYFLYLPALAANIFVAAFFNILIFDRFVDWLLPDYYFISYFNYWDMVSFMFVYAAVSGLLKLSKGWFRWLESEHQIEKLAREKTAYHLSSLKNQVNPHFLFNTLNNIYTLALQDSEKVPGMIMKLSDLMRYMLYEADRDRVPLKKELQYLEDYIELHRLRTDRPENIHFKRTGAAGSLQITPLLLIPFIENAFKHGMKTDVKKGFVKVEIILTEDTLVMKVVNNLGKRAYIEKTNSGGIGLKNVRSRLKAIYPDKHDLQIGQDEQQYRVDLWLKLDPK